MVVVELDAYVWRRKLKELVAEAAQQAEAGLGQAEGEVQQFIDALGRAQAAVRAATFETLPLDLVQRIVSKTIDSHPAEKRQEAARELFDTVLHATPQVQQEALLADLASVRSGISAAHKLVSQVPMGTQEVALDRAGHPPDRKVGEASLERVLEAALVSAVPGVRAVRMAEQVFKSIADITEQIDVMHSLYDEEKALTVEIVHLDDMRDQARFTQGIANLDREIALKRITSSQDLIRAHVSLAAMGAREQKGAIQKAKLRVPLALFYADALRREYDALDRSLALWSGDPLTLRGFVRDRIKANPNSMRLALDPQIGLYTWLDRSLESNRGDLEALRTYWSRTLALVREVCIEAKCTDENSVLGQVLKTGQISLRRITSEAEWERFRHWQKSGTGLFTFSFLLAPWHPVIRDDHAIRADLDDLRIVTARIGGMPSASLGAKPINLYGASLTHPGIGYVLYRGRFVREAFQPAVKHGLEWKNNPEWKSDLYARWNDAPPLRPLEGYSMFTMWQLDVPRSKDAREVADIIVQFHYQTPSDERSPISMTYNEVAVAEAASMIGPKHRLEDRYFAMLNDTADARPPAERWGAFGIVPVSTDVLSQGPVQ
jgi:hypothetical protein